MSADAPAVRLGMGHDSHQFGPADGLWLGGVLIEESPRLFGHSDGDVALHALATAVLSACGLGDIGRLFPADDEANKDASSSTLLAEAVARAAQAGWRPGAAQVALVGARPRLGGERLEEIGTRIAALLGLAPAAVGVTASTGNLSGPEGAGLALSANALVTMVPA